MFKQTKNIILALAFFCMVSGCEILTEDPSEIHDSSNDKPDYLVEFKLVPSSGQTAQDFYGSFEIKNSSDRAGTESIQWEMSLVSNLLDAEMA